MRAWLCFLIAAYDLQTTVKGVRSIHAHLEMRAAFTFSGLRHETWICTSAHLTGVFASRFTLRRGTLLLSRIFVLEEAVCLIVHGSRVFVMPCIRMSK